MPKLLPAIDKCTLANYQTVQTEHIDIDWTVDWQNQTIGGFVVHTMRVLHADGSSQIAFDSSSLDIAKVRDASTGKELEYDIEPRRGPLGSRLNVFLPRPLGLQQQIKIRIDYATTRECTALGWLRPEQSASGKEPFLYSQSQAIHGRSLLPCQDTPAVKATYTSTVRSTLPILMSAHRISPSVNDPFPPIDRATERTYAFDMPIRIPSYLIAIAGGEIAFASLGPRTGVYAQPMVVQDAKWEFERDMEQFLEQAEKILTPYVWGRYDCLVLPASFAYGGMENTCLSTLTPALITGDRSEVDVVAHELSHSWFGNYVSCANWDSFWLNEGWTVYMERMLVRAVRGEQARALEYYMGSRALASEYKRQPPHFRPLHIEYDGQDPDDGYSIIAYEAGANLLLYLERIVGGVEIFLKYAKNYVETFSDTSLTTADWLAHFWKYWSAYPEIEARLRKEVDFDAWLYSESAELPVTMEYDMSLAKASIALAGKWDTARGSSGSSLFSKHDISTFSARQVSLFLETLATFEPFTAEEISSMDRNYEFEKSRNQEHKLRWYALALKAGQRANEAAEWVRTAGRMKYCRPIYRALNKVDPELAKSTFLKYGVSFLHPIARAMVAKDLGVDL